MSKDLISKKVLVKFIKSNMKQGLEQYNLLEYIKNQPTAYDIDAVIKKLEEQKKDNIRVANLDGNTDTKKIAHICRADEDDIAINIIKNIK